MEWVYNRCISGPKYGDVTKGLLFIFIFSRIVMSEHFETRFSHKNRLKFDPNLFALFEFSPIYVICKACAIIMNQFHIPDHTFAWLFWFCKQLNIYTKCFTKKYISHLIIFPHLVNQSSRLNFSLAAMRKANIRYRPGLRAELPLVSFMSGEFDSSIV